MSSLIQGGALSLITRQNQVNHFPEIKSTSIILKQPQLVENVQTMLSDN